MKKIILAGIEIRKDKIPFENRMEETAALCEACGLEVAGIITQQSDSMDPNTAFRKGKLEELKRFAEETEADGIIFHNSLSIRTANRIAAYCNTEVKDRTALILDIFSLRARSRQAKIQTELARLEYALPRVLNTDETAGHERGGGVTNRGAGEMRSAVIARKYKARIQDLKKELQSIRKQNFQDERRRAKTMLKRAALVGYTNAGKSSFMNAVLEYTNAKGTRTYAEDMLFATLDTSVRRIGYKGSEFLLYDTVGFVSDLPHTLVEAFQTTLESAKDADLLIHVIDASAADFAEKASITDETLKRIGAGDIPVVRIFNKIDLAEERPKGICISCFTGEGIGESLQKILEALYPEQDTFLCEIPYDKMSLASQYRSVLRIEIMEHRENGILAQISGETRFLLPFRKYAV